MSTEFWIALGSIGTLLVVLINVVIIFIIPRWKRPKFSIEFIATQPFCRDTLSSSFTSAAGAVPTYWTRLRVRNSGKSVAKSCLGKLVSVMDANGQEIQPFDPTQLHWVSTDWGAVPFRSIDLDRDDYEYLDILATQTNDKEIYLAGNQFPWARYQQGGIITSLPPGKYILRITAYGDDVKARTKYVSLIWRGSNHKDISVEVHDNLRNAKSWFRKAGS